MNKTGKVFKSQYHKEPEKFQLRQSYEYIPKKVKDEAVSVATNRSKFYTLSKNGITTFINDESVEFIKIESWLAERSQFQLISQKKFFKRYRSWKILRRWRLNILGARRQEVTASLKGKLFMTDDVFGPILLRHRAACQNLEKLRVLDFQQPHRDSQSIVDFQLRQKDRREKVEEAVKRTSDESRALFKQGINSILDALRIKIHKLDEIDSQEELQNSVKMEGYNNFSNYHGNSLENKILK